MLGAVLVLSISTIVTCNPSQRYPYVFLLDIGNEEIQETTSEQIRLSMVGGSATLRFPAVGDGDYITHIRVTGVDFGANLMATVIDGGPGYKYAVVAVAGNHNIPYEVVMTFNTLKEDPKFTYFKTIPPVIEKDMSYEGSPRNEDYHSDEIFEGQKTRADHFKSSEMYVENRPIVVSDYPATLNQLNAYEVSAQDVSGQSNLETIHTNEDNFYNANEIENESKENYHDDYHAIDGNNFKKYSNIQVQGPRAEPYSFATNENYQSDEEKSIGVVDQNLYDKYKALRPHLGDDVQVYSYKPGDNVDQSGSVSDPEEIDQMFNDEETHSIPEQSKDSNNNNYVYNDGESAVAY